MAGSRRSPVLRDQWRGASDTGDQRGRERNRPRGSHRDRGRDRFRDRERRRRPKDARPDHSRSPPPRSFPQGDHEPHRREISPPTAPARDSTGLPYSELNASEKLNRHPSPQPAGFTGPEPHHRSSEKDQRDHSPSAPPPSKRKRTRSPSPGGFHDHPPFHNRGPPSRQGDDFDRGFPSSKRRGRLSGRGRAGRRSPRRGRDRRTSEGGRRNRSRPRRSRSPPFGGKPYPHPRRRFDSPHPEDDFEEGSRGSRYRSTSRHSLNSVNSKLSTVSHRDLAGDPMMHPSRAAQVRAANSFRSPSPPRPISNHDEDNMSASADPGAFQMHETRTSDARNTQRPRSSRLHHDARQPPTSPQYATSTNSYPGSPHNTSPYSAGRGGHQPPYHGSHGSRRNSLQTNDPQNQYYNSGTHDSSYSYRGGRSGYRGGHQGHGSDRRFSGSGPSSHGRAHFNNLQWNASDSRSRAGPPSPPPHARPSETPPPPPPAEDQPPQDDYEGDGKIFRHSSKDARAAPEGPKHGSENGDIQNVPPPSGPANLSATPNKGGKISFAFKAKAAPAPATKPVPDLAQRMLAREPPPRAAEPPRNRMSTGPPPKFKPDSRFDTRRDRDRDRHRDRDRNRGRNDRREFREPRAFREPRDGRDNRRDDRRFDSRQDRRRGERPQDFHPERRRERSPEPVKKPRIMLRAKPRPTISEEFAESDSVYYRKPGNESVIGAGTYGKVFKAIHVYTEKKVALKKIRMEGEKDGFPVTAVREIKLLQHLRNHNVVSLLEVMVEKNECFMVFEYLSHDLTGLINHPTFTLTAAHKKDLAKQMFEGLNYLHHRSVLHRDIKAANILISNRGQLKFADFGLARFFSKSRQIDYTNRVITIWYRPPELLLGETRYGPAVDVWSAACVYVEMFTKKAVFPGEGGEISQLEKLYNALGTPTRAEWPDVTEMPWFELMRPTERRKRIFEEVYRDILSPAALDLVSQIFRYDPAKRPTAEEVLAHPYFTSEEPSPQQPIELENIEGDWHEFESKALRKERDKEARRAEYQRDKEKRKALPTSQSEREMKRVKAEAPENPTAVPQASEQF